MVSFIKESKEWLKSILIAIIIALAINNGLVVNATVPTSSMETTIMVGDRVIANRLAYLNEEPARGDIVVFIQDEDNGKPYVKRLIGLPGDTVEIINGTVYIDGTKLEEPYADEEDTRSFGPYEVPSEHYFFLGDNRSVSKDARLWNNPYIEKEKILGKVIFRLFPAIRIY